MLTIPTYQLCFYNKNGELLQPNAKEPDVQGPTALILRGTSDFFKNVWYSSILRTENFSENECNIKVHCTKCLSKGDNVILTCCEYE